METEAERRFPVLKRIKSFLWRGAAYLFVAFLAWAASPENLDILQLSPTTTAIIALILGEITKYYNSRNSA